MTEAANRRLERIQKLLDELHYEIARGVMEREIEPFLQWRKMFPHERRVAVLEVLLKDYPADRLPWINEKPQPFLKLVE